MFCFYTLTFILMATMTSVLAGGPQNTTPYGELAPPASSNDAIARQLKEISQLIEAEKSHPRKQTRDGFFGDEGGSLIGLLLKLQTLQALLAALAPPAAAAPPAAGSGAATTAASGGAAPAPAAPAGLSLAQLLALMQLGGGGGGFGFGGDDDDAKALQYDPKNCDVTGSICDAHTDIQTLVAFPNHILAIGDKNAFRIELDGTPTDPVGEAKYSEFAKVNGTPTATLRINENYYIFYGSEVALLDRKTQAPLHTMAVKDLFFGVKEPVRGAFRFNDHSLTLFLDKHFVFYQPLANPPVDPRFSPQPISVIPNGPDAIDGALEINGTNYLYRQGWLYEVAVDEMVVVAKIPLRQSGLTAGWLKCAGRKNCN